MQIGEWPHFSILGSGLTLLPHERQGFVFDLLASKALQRCFLLQGVPFQVEKMFTQTLHVLHVNTTVGHRDLSQIAFCQVRLSIVGVYV